MPLPYAPGMIKARCAGIQGSGEFGMIFHFVQASGAVITDADATTFANDIRAAWNADINSLIVNTTALTSVVVEGLESAVDGVGAWAGSEYGSIGGFGEAANVCVLQKDTVALRYRGGHPRHYWPAPHYVDLADPTHLTSTAQAAWQGGVSSFISDCVTAAQTLWGAGSGYSALSYYSGGALRPSPLQMPVLGSSIETMLATQRRRIGR